MERKLMRSRTDVELAGVCSGMAKYFDIDVSIVRALWVISALLGGAGLGVYIVFAIIVPQEPKNPEIHDMEEEFIKEDKGRDERNKTYLALGLIGIGVILALKIIIPEGAFQFVWPLALIAGGILLLKGRD